jgi:hypothetical protein
LVVNKFEMSESGGGGINASIPIAQSRAALKVRKVRYMWLHLKPADKTEGFV